MAGMKLKPGDLELDYAKTAILPGAWPEPSGEEGSENLVERLKQGTGSKAASLSSFKAPAQVQLSPY